jgi:hypothetical protein
MVSKAERARRLEIDGVSLLGPSEGFGKLWRKTCRVALDGSALTPEEVISAWKAHFGEFWPEGNSFYTPFRSLTPGDIAEIKVDVAAGLALSTGVAVLSSSPVAFTLITPEGHLFAGLITLSAFSLNGCTVAQSEVVMRASDPLFEVGMALYGHRREDRFWEETLGALARFFGSAATPVSASHCLDHHYQWAYVWNIRNNALLRAAIARSVSPAARITRAVRRRVSRDQEAIGR